MKQKAFRIKEGYTHLDMGSEVIIYDNENSVLFTFNESASLMFKLLNQGKSIEYIADFITKTYKIDKEIVIKDHNELIRDLKEKNIIE